MTAELALQNVIEELRLYPVVKQQNQAETCHTRRHEEDDPRWTKHELGHLPAGCVRTVQSAQNEVSAIGTNRDLNESEQAL